VATFFFVATFFTTFFLADLLAIFATFLGLLFFTALDFSPPS
jgi:hypothetical protein